MTEIMSEYGEQPPGSRVELRFVCLVCGKLYDKYPEGERCGLFTRVIFDGDVVEWIEPGVRARRVRFDHHSGLIEATLNGSHKLENLVDESSKNPDTPTSLRGPSGAREKIERSVPDHVRAILKFPEDDDAEDSVKAFGLPGRGRAAK